MLGWESYFNDSERHDLALLSLSAGNLGISLLAVVLSVTAYLVLTGQQINTMPLPELLLLATNLLGFVYVVVLAAWLRPAVHKKGPSPARRHAR